jgi:hypothetical protein
MYTSHKIFTPYNQVTLTYSLYLMSYEHRALLCATTITGMDSALLVPYIPACCMIMQSVNVACITYALLLATYFVGNFLTLQKQQEFSHFPVNKGEGLSHWHCYHLLGILSTITRIPLQNSESC